MKKSTIFIFSMLYALGNFGLVNANEITSDAKFYFDVKSAYAQGFFIPGYELEPKYEKLPPVKRENPKAQTLKDFNNKYEIEKYVLIDGVYSPVYKKRTVPTPAVQSKEYSDEYHPQVIADDVHNKEEKVAIQTKKLEAETPYVAEHDDLMQDFAQVAFDEGAPMYRNIFAQYRLDAQEFRKTKKHPFNNNLDESLAKMASGNNIVIFSGELNVK